MRRVPLSISLVFMVAGVAAAADPPLAVNQTCVRFLIRLAEDRGKLPPGVWKGKAPELEPEVVQRLIRATLSPAEQQELNSLLKKSASAEANPAQKESAAPLEHGFFNRLLEQESTPSRPLFEPEDIRYIDDIEFSKLMTRARNGDKEAQSRIGEILPPVLQRQAAHALYDLSQTERDDAVSRVLFYLVRGNYAFTLSEVRTPTSKNAYASYFRTALVRAGYHVRKARNNGGKEIAHTDISGDRSDEGGDRLTLIDTVTASRQPKGSPQTESSDAVGELKRIREQIIPLLPSLEGKVLEYQLNNPSATIVQIQQHIGANSPQAAKLAIDRARDYVQLIDELQNKSEDGILSFAARSLTPKERDVFSLLGIVGKSADQTANTIGHRATSINPAYFSAVAKMEQAVRSQRPERLGEFWDRIFETSGVHGDILNSMVDRALELGRLPTREEFPEELTRAGWSAEQVYGTNNFRPRPNVPDNFVFNGATYLNWLILREIANRQKVLTHPEVIQQYARFDPYESRWGTRPEVSEPWLFDLLKEQFREPKQGKVIARYIEHYLQHGEPVDLNGGVAESLGVTRSRLFSEGADYNPGSRFEKTGVFQSKSEFYEQLDRALQQYRKQVEQRLSSNPSEASREKLERLANGLVRLQREVLAERASPGRMSERYRDEHPWLVEQSSALPVAVRNVVDLRWDKGKSVAQTAQELRMSETQVVSAELQALDILRGEAMKTQRELAMGREIFLTPNSLPSQVTEHLYSIWKSNPRGFDFSGTAKMAEQYITDRWPEVGPRRRTGVFRGADHAVWMLRQKIAAELSAFPEGSVERLAHQTVVDRAERNRSTGVGYSRNPYRGNVSAQLVIEKSDVEPSPRQPKPTRPTQTEKRTEKRSEDLSRALNSTLPVATPLVAKQLKALSLNVPQQVVIARKWAGAVSSADLVNELPRRQRHLQAVVDAETSILYKVGMAGTTEGRGLEIQRELLQLPTLQTEIAVHLLGAVERGENLDEATDVFYQTLGVTRPSARAWKLRPFQNQAHRDWFLAELAQKRGLTETRDKILKPYRRGGSRRGGMRTEYLTDLLKAADSLESAP